MTVKTLYDKLWDAHVVRREPDGAVLLYIDRHLVHEVTSPQAFEGLRLNGRRPWRAASSLAVADHNVPTKNRSMGILDPISRRQVQVLTENCRTFGITLFDMDDSRQGIVHVVGPEQGATLPGMTVVCGDSHTATHGALGALAFGIGTSEVEHVLATQCLIQKKAKNMRVAVEGRLAPGVSAKDVVLAIIAEIGTAGATGYTIEFTGRVIRDLSMEGRMTVCNMAMEAGARSGLVAVDEKTIDYVRGRPFAPTGPAWEDAQSAWKTLESDPGAVFDRTVSLKGEAISPMVTWGTSPEMALPIGASIPDPSGERDADKKTAMERALAYMDLVPGTALTDVPLDKVFIGSCTNGRLEDLRAAARILRGREIAPTLKQALVVPGSGLVKAEAEKIGLDRLFTRAGFEWRDPGCSMCLAMNADHLSPGERCAATSNRNFEGRQGFGSRTHLVSPAMAAAAAVAGRFVDVRTFVENP